MSAAAPSPGLIALASDHAGFALKEQLKPVFEQLGRRFEDLGTRDETSCDYPDFAHRAARGLTEGRFALAVLVCGTGIGMSIAANRHPGVRAAVCTESFAARMARAHNDANVLCLGARIVGLGVAQETLRAFLEARFEGGRHGGRVRKLEPGSST
ncbi:MAG: ribose 5-phosphate isomerase B [Polyangiales bacterium]